MKNCIRSQLYILLSRKQFKFIFGISLGISLLSFLLNMISYYGQYYSDVMSYRDTCLISNSNALSSVFVIVLPIFSTLAFCDRYIEDKKANRLPIVFQRCKRSEYYFSSLIISALSPILTIFIPIMINLILSAIAFPDTSFADFTGLASNQGFLYSNESEYMTMLAFKKLFILHPFIYSVLFAVLMTIYSCAGAALTYSISYYIKNRGMVIVVFFVFNAFTTICSSFVYERFNINTSITNYILSESAEDGINYIVFTAYIIVMLAVSFVFSKSNIKRLGETL